MRQQGRHQLTILKSKQHGAHTTDGRQLLTVQKFYKYNSRLWAYIRMWCSYGLFWTGPTHLRGNGTKYHGVSPFSTTVSRKSSIKSQIWILQVQYKGG